jgi:hypothetical protein
VIIALDVERQQISIYYMYSTRVLELLELDSRIRLEESKRTEWSDKSKRRRKAEDEWSKELQILHNLGLYHHHDDVVPNCSFLALSDEL